MCNIVSGIGGGLFRAEAKKGVSKYGATNSGGVARGSGLNEQENEILNELVSLGLSKSTWSNYKTAERMLKKCCEEKGMQFSLPVTEEVVMKFVLWLAGDRKLSSGTISVYLSGLKHMHTVRGLNAPVIRSDQVDLILKGLSNKIVTEKRETGVQGRKPITPDLLRLIKARVNESSYDKRDKRMLWSICSLTFFGAFRSNELLCREVSGFDPAFELCTQDIRIEEMAGGEQVLRVNVKAPKESKEGKSVVVDVFQSVEELCPVRAFRKWRECSSVWEYNQPVFRWQSGRPLTPAKLNEVLRERLKGFVEDEQCFSSHSFRIGAASMMGQLGFGDSDIMALGRWSSRAFEGYVRLPRTKRMGAASQFSKEIR
jgi:Phage integrase SAM-like domain